MNDVKCELCNNPAKWIVSREYKDGRFIEGLYCERCANYVLKIERVYYHYRKNWWNPFLKQGWRISDDIAYMQTELIDKTIPQGKKSIFAGMGYGPKCVSSCCGAGFKRDRHDNCLSLYCGKCSKPQKEVQR